jgi:predicted aspartyl protease
MRFHRLVALVLACAWSGAVWAADCKPLNIVSSLDMTPGDDAGRMYVPISLNGVEKSFLVDTGGIYPQISEKTAEELKLSPHQSNIEFYSVDGSVTNKAVWVDNFVMGKLRADKMELPVAPRSIEIMSPTAFSRFDFEMNFAARKMNILSSDHCEGKVVYWPAHALAVVPIKMRDFHIEVPVQLDGKDFRAIIDTGASRSTINADAARQGLGLSRDTAGMTPDGHLGNDETAVIYSYPFKTLTFEGVTVSNPRIAILPDRMGKNADRSHKMNSLIERHSDDVALPEIIIGMNVLSKFHLYFAFKEQKLYITDAGG